MPDAFVRHSFFPVGQGLFASGKIVTRRNTTRSRFWWVYDCGSSTDSSLVNKAISRLKKWRGSKCKKIDILTLSHFHRDHISGAVNILSNIGAKSIMLPWAPLWNRLIIAFDQGVNAGDPEILFFIDPVQYFSRVAPDGFEQFLFVSPSEGDGPSFPSPEAPTRFDPLEDSAKREGSPNFGEPVDDADLEILSSQHSRSAFILRSGRSIRIDDFWEFIPYNDPSTAPADSSGFQLQVNKFKADLLSGDDVRCGAALKKLRQLYVTTFGMRKMNDLSLVLYGGIIPNKPLGGYPVQISANFTAKKFSPLSELSSVAILLTGDANFSEPSKWDSLERYLNPRRARGVGVFQVPHHGAASSWYFGFADAVSPQTSVFSACSGHRYGHPHPDVWSDFLQYRPALVNRNYGFYLHAFLLF